jgi:hypothetical protein
MIAAILPPSFQTKPPRHRVENVDDESKYNRGTLPQDFIMFFIVAVVMLISAFTQTLTGFGSALVSMPILSPLLGIQVASPLVALMAITLEAILLIRLRSASIYARCGAYRSQRWSASRSGLCWPDRSAKISCSPC